MHPELTIGATCKTILQLLKYTFIGIKKRTKIKTARNASCPFCMHLMDYAYIVPSKQENPVQGDGPCDISSSLPFG